MRKKFFFFKSAHVTWNLCKGVRVRANNWEREERKTVRQTKLERKVTERSDEKTDKRTSSVRKS